MSQQERISFTGYVGIVFVGIVVVSTTARATSIGTFDAVASMAEDENIVEATLVSSALQTFESRRTTFVCGVSHRFLISDALKGTEQHYVDVTDRIWLAAEMTFGNVESNNHSFQIGGKYLISYSRTEAHQKPEFYEKRGPIEQNLPAEIRGRQGRACLAALPAAVLHQSFEVRQEDWPASQKSTLGEYVFLRWDRADSSELLDLAIGAEANFSYLRTVDLDPEARAYLTTSGRYSPAELEDLRREFETEFPDFDASTSTTLNLEELGRNGSYIFFDYVFRYEDFKQLLIDRISMANKRRLQKPDSESKDSR